MKTKREIKIGDLVKITRASGTAFPPGTIGVVLSASFADSGFKYYKTKIINSNHLAARRILGRDLEVISESR